MPHSVHLARHALREIDEALAWLVERSPTVAGRWYERLLAAIKSLESNPERCALAPESDWYTGGELRQFLYGKRQGVYRILFEIRGHTVFILRVRHHAQDWLTPDEM